MAGRAVHKFSSPSIDQQYVKQSWIRDLSGQYFSGYGQNTGIYAQLLYFSVFSLCRDQIQSHVLEYFTQWGNLLPTSEISWIYNLSSVPQITQFWLVDAIISSKENSRVVPRSRKEIMAKLKIIKKCQWSCRYLNSLSKTKSSIVREVSLYSWKGANKILRYKTS